jgi:hypothetical protein
MHYTSVDLYEMIDYCDQLFFYPTMLKNCFRYYKDCELCKKVKDVQLVSAAMLRPIIK